MVTCERTVTPLGSTMVRSNISYSGNLQVEITLNTKCFFPFFCFLETDNIQPTIVPKLKEYRYQKSTGQTQRGKIQRYKHGDSIDARHEGEDPWRSGHWRQHARQQEVHTHSPKQTPWGNTADITHGWQTKQLDQPSNKSMK